MKRWVLGLMVLGMGVKVLGQVSEEEAYRRLEERRQQRAGQAATEPATRPTSRAVGVVKPELLEEGRVKLRTGDFQGAVEAVKAFQGGLVPQRGKLTDVNWINSYHVMAAAYMRMGQFDKAREGTDRIYYSGKKNRSIVINGAMEDIVLKRDAARGVKSLREYVMAQPGDEMAVDLWGVGMSEISETGKNVKAGEFEEDFGKANTVLEGMRPGMKHWGMEWMTAHEFAPIEQQIRVHKDKADFIKHRLEDAVVDYNSAEAKYKAAMVVPMGNRGTLQQSQFDDHVRADRARFAGEEADKARLKVEEYQTQLADEEKEMPKAKWVMPMVPVEPEMVE